MNKITKKATVFVYVMFLVTLSLVFASLAIDNFASLSNYNSYFQKENILLENIRTKAKISIDLDKKLNSDGFWFIDNISCPKDFTMSWNTIISTTISTDLFFSWSQTYCSWIYNSKSLEIYFNSWYTDFEKASFDNNIFETSLVNWVWNFADLDSTNIDFSWKYLLADNMDDNFNSDNYKWNSTWNINYSNDYLDNDDLSRKMIFWYIPPEFNFKNIFWSNSKVSNYIRDNSNNNNWFLVWETWTWYLYLDIDRDYELKFLKIDKANFNISNEFKIMQTIKWSWSWTLWYLQNDWSLSGSTSDNYKFDFINNDYAIFLKSTWTWTLFYKMRIETSTWANVYINPINDSFSDKIKYLWTDILYDDKWAYFPKIMEIIFGK